MWAFWYLHTSLHRPFSRNTFYNIYRTIFISGIWESSQISVSFELYLAKHFFKDFEASISKWIYILDFANWSVTDPSRPWPLYPPPPPPSLHVTWLKLNLKELFSSPAPCLPAAPVTVSSANCLPHSSVPPPLRNWFTNGSKKSDGHTIQKGDGKQKAQDLIGINRLIPTFDPLHTHHMLHFAGVNTWPFPTCEPETPQVDPLLWNSTFLFWEVLWRGCRQSTIVRTTARFHTRVQI